DQTFHELSLFDPEWMENENVLLPPRAQHFSARPRFAAGSWTHQSGAWRVGPVREGGKTTRYRARCSHSPAGRTAGCRNMGRRRNHRWEAPFGWVSRWMSRLRWVSRLAWVSQLRWVSQLARSSQLPWVSQLGWAFQSASK